MGTTLALGLLIVVLIVSNATLYRLPDRWYLPAALGSLAAVLVVMSLAGLTAEQTRVSPAALARGVPVALGLTAAVALVFAAMTATRAGRRALADDSVTKLSGRTVAWRALVVVPLGTVVPEEVAFRGVLLALLERQTSVVWAVIGSSLLFGLWHVLSSIGRVGDNALARHHLGDGLLAEAFWIGGSVLSTAVAGLAFATLTVWTNSLLPALALHWAINGFGYLAGWYLSRKSPQLS